MKKILCLIFPALIAGVMLLVTSCSKKSGSDAESDVAYYTCAMHPSVKSHDPKAKCPICSMDLIAVKKKAAGETDAKSMGMSAEEHAKMHSGKGEMKEIETPEEKGAKDKVEEQPTEFSVPIARQQMIGVTYAPVEKRPLQKEIRTVGIVAYDKQRHWDYVSRVEGYVQKLFVSSRGELVEKNAPLLTIYSPELLTTQREFLNLLRMRDEAKKSGSTATAESAESLIESAKVRLRLWNIGDEQISKLEESRKAEETLTLFSPFKGVIQDLPVDQGRRVMMGDHLVDIADLSVIWVWAEFYQDELPLLKKGLTLSISTSTYPNEKFTGEIVAIDPFINEAKRTGRVRIEVKNADFKLQPDMYVDVTLELKMGEGLTVPLSAVMPTGQRNIVFLDKGEGKLEPRFIELAGKFGEFYAVKSGLKSGDRVVSSANFLIDAESKIQGALKSF
ncbi:MAG: efflux RND transporter periplasmic adaptor subunit [Verrucomicrobiota bacterium]